jgi:hypothetical protein
MTSALYTIQTASGIYYKLFSLDLFTQNKTIKLKQIHSIFLNSTVKYADIFLYSFTICNIALISALYVSAFPISPQ